MSSQDAATEWSLTVTIPIQLTVRIGTPLPADGATAVATAQAPAPDAAAVSLPATPVPATTVQEHGAEAAEAAVEPSVEEARARFDRNALSSDSFTWKTTLAAAVCSHLAYEPPQVVLTTARDRFGFQACEFLQTDATECFLAATPDCLVVTFRGTAGLRDWLGNLNLFSTSASYGSLHRGFYFAFQAVRSSLEQILHHMGTGNRRIVLAGHSLGGALATVAAAEWLSSFDIRGIYTFGQPRVCREDTANHIGTGVGDRFFRVVNDDDIVARIPPGYEHVGMLIRLRADAGVSHESMGAGLLPGESAALTESQFEALQTSVRQMPTAGRFENAALEGLFPGFPDHAITRYLARILQQPMTP